MHAQYFALINLNCNIQILKNELPAQILYPFTIPGTYHSQKTLRGTFYQMKPQYAPKVTCTHIFGAISKNFRTVIPKEINKIRFSLKSQQMIPGRKLRFWNKH